MLVDEINKLDLEIKVWFFEIIKEVQYIEKNLASVIATTFFKTNDITDIKLLERKSEEVLKSIQNKTLGQIIAYSQDYKVFTDSKKYKTLQEILSFRNDLVHSYFKKNNYDLNLEKANREFFKDILFDLKSKSDLINEFNNDLCIICEKNRKDVLRILKRK